MKRLLLFVLLPIIVLVFSCQDEGNENTPINNEPVLIHVKFTNKMTWNGNYVAINGWLCYVYQSPTDTTYQLIPAMPQGANHPDTTVEGDVSFLKQGKMKFTAHTTADGFLPHHPYVFINVVKGQELVIVMDENLNDM